MELKFRLLRADEIEARVGTAKDGGTGVSLLLYKDARCDMNLLDETVGPMNWKREHSRDNANCTVSLWDLEKGQWVSKEDTGTQSNTEAEKGLASDSFKRACFNWGIGRELYTSPFVWISGDPKKLKYERYSVSQIAYDEQRCVSDLVIVSKGRVVFEYHANKQQPSKQEPAQKPEQRKDAVIAVSETVEQPQYAVTSLHSKLRAAARTFTETEIATMRGVAERCGVDSKGLNDLKNKLAAVGRVPPVPFAQMTPAQLAQALITIEREYANVVQN